jgi:hypothetical protein
MFPRFHYTRCAAGGQEKTAARPYVIYIHIIHYMDVNCNTYFAFQSLVAINRMQEAFAGEAERVGLTDEQDVVDMVKEIRRDRWEKR